MHDLDRAGGDLARGVEFIEVLGPRRSPHLDRIGWPTADECTIMHGARREMVSNGRAHGGGQARGAEILL